MKDALKKFEEVLHTFEDIMDTIMGVIWHFLVVRVLSLFVILIIIAAVVIATRLFWFLFDLLCGLILPDIPAMIVATLVTAPLFLYFAILKVGGSRFPQDLWYGVWQGDDPWN